MAAEDGRGDAVRAVAFSSLTVKKILFLSRQECKFSLPGDTLDPVRRIDGLSLDAVLIPFAQISLYAGG